MKGRKRVYENRSQQARAQRQRKRDAVNELRIKAEAFDVLLKNARNLRVLDGSEALLASIAKMSSAWRTA